MKKNIGGDRLGSGNKMNVDLKTFNRSTFDNGMTWRSTMAPGTLVPFLTEVALPGDTFDINLDAFVNTLPTTGPLFGSMKLQIDAFQIPIRLYQRALHNNKLGIGLNMSQVKLPQLSILAKNIDPNKSIDNQHTNPSSLLAHLDMRGFGNNTGIGQIPRREMCAIPYLGFWDIYKNYYANKQEEIGVFINNEIDITPTITLMEAYNAVGANTTIPLDGSGPNVNFQIQNLTTLIITHTGIRPNWNTVKLNIQGTAYTLTEIFDYIDDYSGTNTSMLNPKAKFIGKPINNYRYLNVNETLTTEPQLKTFPLSNIDQMREDILAAPLTSPFIIDENTYAPYGTSLPAPGQTYPPLLSSLEGLPLKTYQSDLFNNWMLTEWIDGTNGVNEITKIDTSGGSFGIDTLILARKVYDMLNAIAISGGSYNNWIEAVYGQEPPKKAETPMYMGGLIKEIVFEEVISNSQANSGDGQQPLGTLAGKGRLNDKHKGGRITIHVDEHSYIMLICSITPRIDYSQGNKWHVNLKTMDDFHKPHLDQIGFQDLITEQMHWADTYYDFEPGNERWITKSAGKQPAWLNYMTNVNVVRGNFAIEPGDEAEGGGQMYMTLNRKYETEGTGTNLKIKDLTTYIDPVKCNQIFAQTRRDAQNFWVQIGVNMQTRRLLSSKIMPNL